LLDTLLAQVNSQLEAQGCQVEKSKGAIVDATLIQSAARPAKTWEAVEGGEAAAYMMPDKPELSKDPDATWSKKGSKSHFGYKGFMVTGRGGWICDPRTCHVWQQGGS